MLSSLVHQEHARLVSEIEELFFASQAAHLPLESIQFYLLNDLGYADLAEFEDALGGTFENFLRTKMPNCSVREVAQNTSNQVPVELLLEDHHEDEQNSPTTEEDSCNTTTTTTTVTKLVFSLAPKVVKPAQTLNLKIRSRDDLWRVFLFAPSPARVEIPELEFEAAGGDKTCIDSIYNHLARAITNLEQHASALQLANNRSSESSEKLLMMK